MDTRLSYRRPFPAFCIASPEGYTDRACQSDGKRFVALTLVYAIAKVIRLESSWRPRFHTREGRQDAKYLSLARQANQYRLVAVLALVIGGRQVEAHAF